MMRSFLDEEIARIANQRGTLLRVMAAEGLEEVESIGTISIRHVLITLYDHAGDAAFLAS